MVKTTRWFQDPIDGTRFKKRDDCFQHMAKQGHSGTPLVIEEKQEETKQSPKPHSRGRGRGGRRGKRFLPYHCGECKYQGKTLDDLDKHQKAKRHKGYKKINEEGTTLSSGSGGGRNKEVEGKKPDVPEKPKDTRGPVQKELEDNFEKNYGRPYDVFIRISEESYALIKKEIPKGIEHHDQTGNHLMYIPKGKYREFDYLMFIHDFVEIEMEIKDVVYAMSFFEAKKENEGSKLISWDMAEYREMNIVEISDVGGCFVVHHTKTSDKLPVADAIKALSTFEDQSKLACVGGMWQYVYEYHYKKPKNKEDVRKGKTNKSNKGGATSAAGRMAQQTLDQHYQHHTEEYRAELVKESEWDRYGGWNTAPAKSSYPREPRWHPVYGIADGIVIIDRLIDYLKVYYPPEK